MDILMPQLGETVAEGKITKWFKQAGDVVAPGDNLFEIETDKTSMEVPSTSAGVLAEIRIATGEVVPVGAVVAVLADSAEAAAAHKSAPQVPLIPAKAGIQNQPALGPRLRGDERSLESAPAPKSIALDPFRAVRTPERNFGPARIAGGIAVTPLARRLASENGIDLSRVTGSGPHGRIVARDVEAKVVPAQIAAAPVAAAPLYLTADVGMGALLKLRDEVNAMAGYEIEVEDFVVKAYALALRAQDGVEPADISVAASPNDATLVPVIRAADAKSVGAIAKERRAFAARASEGKLPPEDCRGGVGSVVNPGRHGVRECQVPVRPPHASLLAMGAIGRRAIEAEDGGVRFESAMTVTLSCDSRVLDAMQGARLLAAIRGYLEQPLAMLV